MPDDHGSKGKGAAEAAHGSKGKGSAHGSRAKGGAHGSKAKGGAHGSNKIKNWSQGQKIGDGGFAKVYLATDNDTKEKFVIKTVDRSDLETRLALENERKVLRGCYSPYIIKYLGWAVTKHPETRQISNDLFIEFVQRGSVLAHVKRNGGGLEEPVIATYTRDILRGLHYVHERGIIHGDLKCDNLLVGERNIILCDFGSAKFINNGDLVMAPKLGEAGRPRRIFVTGTAGWMAPEVEDEIQQDYASDIYSLGCCIVEMCTGEPPGKDPAIYVYEDDEDDEDFRPCTVDVPPNYSHQCQNFVELCLKLDPDERPEADDLLSHPWIVNAPPYPKMKLKNQRQLPRPKTFLASMTRMMGCGSSTDTRGKCCATSVETRDQCCRGCPT